MFYCLSSHPSNRYKYVLIDDKCGLIVSEKALKAFKTENISGYIAEPIEINDDKVNDEVAAGKPQYYYLYVNGIISFKSRKSMLIM